MLGIIKAIVLIMACVGIASLIIKMIDRDVEIKPYVVGWSLLMVLMFLTGTHWIVIGYVFLIKFVYLKNDVERNITFYLLLFTALPYNQIFPVVPGINLLTTTMPGLLSLVFLFPVLFRILTQEEFKLRKLDGAFFLLMLVFIAGIFRESSEYAFTVPQAIRETFALTIAIVVPYVVISRGIRTREALYRILIAFLFSGLVLALLAYIEVAFQWRPYVDIGMRMGLIQSFMDTFYEWRGGFLRVTATLTGPITFGFYLSFVLAVLMFVMRLNRTPWILRFLLIGIILGAVFFTGSRGALLGSAAFLLVYFVLNMQASLRRFVLIPLLGLAIVSTFFNTAYRAMSGDETTTESIQSADEYGTVEYRTELLKTSLKVIPDHLWFGSRQYRADERMLTLVQGQGIVDIVNGYLSLSLEWGIVGLTLFLYVLFRGYFLLLRIAAKEDDLREELELLEESVDDDEAGIPKEPFILSAAAIAFAALAVSLAIQFAFTSYSSTIVVVIWITLALVRAIRNIDYIEEISEEEGEAASSPQSSTV